jgi:nucleoid-associated protein YgaU/DNA-binding SARP family transcriptional activator
MNVATSRTGSRRLADASRGFVALLGAFALTIGVPFGLIAWVGWPLPAEMPTLHEITDALRDTYIPDAFLIKSLALICWLVWVELVASLIVETVAYLRGRQAGRVPLASSKVQRAAARLVATSALLGALLATRGMPEMVNRSLRPPESVTLVVDQQRADVAATEQAAETPDTALPTYEVQRRDTLWGIAETHLGDPFRWPEIFDLNRGQPQPDGRVLRDPDLICPGWTLQLPADAVVAAPPPAPEPAAATPAAPTADPASSTTAPPAGDGMILVDEAALGEGGLPTEIVASGGAVSTPAPAAPAPGSTDDEVAAAPTEAPKPAAAAVAPGQPTAPAPSPQPGLPASQVTVQPGDNFWDLAEAQLTAAWGRPPTDGEIVGYWQSLVDGNRDRLAPPGDPDLIYPGQVFTTPATPADPTVAATPPAPPAPPAGTTPTPAPTTPPDSPATTTPADSGSEPGSDADSGVDTPTTTEGSDADSGPAVTTPPTSVADPGSGEATDGPGSTAGAPATDTTAVRRDSDSAALPVGLIGGGVALAGVVILLERRRRAQLRHRDRGRMIEMPPPPLQHNEREMREGAEVDRARLLDLAVRAASAGSGATGLPALRWVEVTAQSVLLVLESPAPPPPGFTALGADRWITHAPLDKLTAIAGRVEMPVPTLVPVGTTAEDAEVLIELEAGGVVTIAGASDEALEVLRAMAVAAATAPWGEQSHVVLVGMEGELLDLPWVNTLPQLSEAIAKAEAHVDRTTSALRSLRCPSTSQARAAGVSPESWEPLLVVSAIQPSDLGERQRLVALAARPRSATAVVTPAGGTPLGVGLTMTIAENGWLHIDDVDVDVWPHRLDDGDAGVLMALLDVAAQRGDVDLEEQLDELDVRRPPSPPPPPPPPPPAAEGPTVAVEDPSIVLPPAEGDGEAPEAIVVSVPEAPAAAAPAVRPLEALMGGVEVLVRVLGEVEAVRLTPASPEGPEERLVPTRQKGLEAIAYLALREAAVDREDLEINLFPDGANAAKTVYNTVSSARMLVGEELFPPTQGGRYELSDRVVTDYGLFCELVAQADETDEVAVAADLLTEALGLVRGEPFTGVGRGYAWVGPHRGMIVAQVVDAAEELAEVKLAMGDWRAAEWAARRGLRAFPSDERMYRLLMRAARAAGNVPGVQRVFRELCDVIADPDLGVEPEDTLHPETVALLEELTGVVPRNGRLGA